MHIHKFVFDVAGMATRPLPFDLVRLSGSSQHRPDDRGKLLTERRLAWQAGGRKWLQRRNGAGDGGNGT